MPPKDGDICLGGRYPRPYPIRLEDVAEQVKPCHILYLLHARKGCLLSYPRNIREHMTVIVFLPFNFLQPGQTSPRALLFFTLTVVP